MRNLLVTGGAGFIGANFVRYWRSAHPGDPVVVLDALTYAGRRENLADLDGVTFVHGNICDCALVEATLSDHAIDTIVHFAAESHVDNALNDPGPFLHTNVVGTYTILEAVRRRGVRLPSLLHSCRSHRSAAPTGGSRKAGGVPRKNRALAPSAWHRVPVVPAIPSPLAKPAPAAARALCRWQSPPRRQYRAQCASPRFG